jgi:hypothetical protein
MSLILLLMITGLFLPQSQNSPRFYDLIHVLAGTGLNPLRAQWASAFSWRELADAWRDGDRYFWYSLISMLFSVFVFGDCALLFWWWAGKRLDKESTAKAFK